MNDESEQTLLRLREAYLDLEATRPLRELGASSAFINHEIKNYMMVISGYAVLLQRSKSMSDRDREMVNNIANTAVKLQEFNMNVLEAARSNAVRPGVEDFDIVALLRSCVGDSFPEQSQRISVTCTEPQGTVLVSGIPEKLSRAFVCALSNSFEAGANAVNVKISVHNYVALVTIDDDGKGCDATEFPNLSKTFYTTKPGASMGLGLCMLRSIIESHGGHVSVYSKNLLGGANHGLSVQLMIPASKKMSYAVSKSEAVLVRDGIESVPAILNVLKRLKIVPRMVDGTKGAAIADGTSSLETVIFAAPKQSAELMVRQNTADAAVKVLTIEESSGGVFFVADVDSDTRELFTEEYVVRYMGTQS